MRFVSFASGSSGNCSLISDGDIHILIDAGISLKRMRSCLAGLGLCFDDLAGVLVTHEHSDHVGGMPMLIKYNPNIHIYAPRSAAAFLRRSIVGADDCVRNLTSGEYLDLNGIGVRAVATLHDTPDSVGYRIEGKNAVFGFCTDLGIVTDEVEDAMSGVNGALLESNYDRDMLLGGPYPPYLKRRILSDHGHLSNDDCAAFALRLAEQNAGQIMLGHLSRENNLPGVALRCTGKALEGKHVNLTAAPPNEAAVMEF